MSSPVDVLGALVTRCPFLSKVSEIQGEASALRLAANASRGVLLEDIGSVDAVFRLFHGAKGPIPLRRTEPEDLSGVERPATAQLPARSPTTFDADATPTRGRCPFAAVVCPESGATNRSGPPQHALATAPLAAISLSGFGFLVSQESGTLASGLKAFVHTHAM